MPNWITNLLTVTGPDAEKVVEENMHEEGNWDFDRVCKCPAELSEVSSPFKGTIPEQASLIKKYGHADWYNWCLANWGCKWNASDTQVVSPTVVRFNTPWSMPDVYMLKLSEKYPSNKFEISWYDENISSDNLGTCCFEDGTEECLCSPETDEEKQDFFAMLGEEDMWLEHIIYNEIERVRYAV